jgi:hypothetical protein
LNQPSAATQNDAAEGKLLASEAGFAILETEIQNWGNEFGIYSADEEIQEMKEVLV